MTVTPLKEGIIISTLFNVGDTILTKFSHVYTVYTNYLNRLRIKY